MLQLRETDALVLFLSLVVVCLVLYILLGKWNEGRKMKGKASLVAQENAEDDLRVEDMAAAAAAVFTPLPVPLPNISFHPYAPSSYPVDSHNQYASVPSPNKSSHQCAKCYSPSTTRCARCKSVRYCSGKCQILHWREVHKHECHLLEMNSNVSSPKCTSTEDLPERSLLDSNMSSQSVECNAKQPRSEKDPSDHITGSPKSTQVPVDSSESALRQRRPAHRKASRKGNKDLTRRLEGNISECPDQTSRSRANPSTSSCTTASSDFPTRNKLRESDSMLYQQHSFPSGNIGNKSTAHNSYNMSQKQNEHDPRTKNHRGRSDALNPETHETNVCEVQVGTSDREDILSGGLSSQGNNKMKEITPQGRNGVANMGIMRMFGLMKSSKVDRQEHSIVKADRHRKLKMLFPYEDFVKYFQYEAPNVSPRGLINCGNSCYANAVLQCLTFTKPLSAFLLHRLHSQSCRGRDWCLMCELEQHVMMLKESGDPLSPKRFLLPMRSINSQIGNGSQEDAHEFLRLFVASMQSICLESSGGEKAVEPRLQETTFIQHTFAGRLRSKVRCLRCHHESECNENIMDLTLEINGWVESLQDALTQFTSPEDLDGDNMYRCGRCSSYVPAQKQLSIQEAPNILTIVLKRFRGGCYGKINKCISFPEMLDMMPYMTGADDVPPLYMLYAVVVHLDRLNASFSGHYISYVKDSHGNWFRVDDTKVQQVHMSQVMSEGAYILFYMRSSPRPDRICTTSKISSAPKSQKPLRPEHMKGTTNHYTSGSVVRNASRNRQPVMGMYSENMDASDWSLFTSSDEASFTTESTRDSFSTVDYAADGTAATAFDPFAPDYATSRTIACNMFSGSRARTTFFSEKKGFVVDSHMPSANLSSVEEEEEVMNPPPDEAFFVDRNVNYGYDDDSSRYGVDPQTGYYHCYNYQL
ncbi:unnamed protein product [Cuscuta campestris]|uniref:ubiquitinyl hydrolase 1 n=1 Tax=Cuscuta campestris TaxID=132261 RepID=A0A484KBN3_9ASTE|nr:unnamed protein product [Cuscuta campestris]